MVYLLIDNCSLRDLIDIHGYSKHLDTLDNCISSKQMTFVSHQLIIDEWNKHKGAWKNQKIKKLINNQKQDSCENNNNLLPTTSLIKISHIDSQISRIDILLKSAYIIQTPLVIQSEFSERYRNRLAPFHKKLQSQNDWEILGSFCHYCDINGIQQLSFVSSNTDDFADVTDLNRIHDDFAKRFNKTSIKYYYDFQKLFDDISDLNQFPIDLISLRIIPNSKYSHKSTIRKNVLDSICYIFKELYAEINFIPLHLLIKYYPFSSSELSNTYYDHFNIYEVSNDLIDFFENISITKDKIYIKDDEALSVIKDYKSKIEFVVQKLNTNLVFHLRGEKRTKEVCTHIEKHDLCMCVNCLYERFEFFSCFNSISDIGTSYKEKLKSAYVSYKVGNYQSANAIYDNICKTAFNDKCYVSYFIAKYNQRHLAAFLSNFITNKKIDYQLINRLKEIDLIEEAWKLKGLVDYNLLIFICQEDYFSDAFQNVTNASTKIIAAYYSQLNAGWSNNNHVSDLIEEFAKVETFLNMNFIIYDQYSNFGKLFERVIEGLFASHAITEGNGSRFEKFGDYWVRKFIEYGSSEKIIQYFRRYNLKKIKYICDGTQKDTFLELFQNLAASKKSLQNVFKDLADENNFYFENNYEKLLESSITMLSIIDIKKSELNKFSIVLLQYLNNENNIKNSLYKALSFFLEQKGAALYSTVKLKYLKLFTTKSPMCNMGNNIVVDILEFFTTNDLKKISNLKLSSIINHAAQECQKCGSNHNIRALSYLYDKGTSVIKREITYAVKSALKSKWNFELFYTTSIYGIIDLDRKKLYELIADLDFDQNKKSTRNIFSGENNFQNHYYDELINLCFKYNINTTTEKFFKLSSVHLCYKWILNMDKFDYSKFDPLWTMGYRLKYFYKAMAKSENLKKALRSYLHDKNHIGIERVLLKITNFVS